MNRFLLLVGPSGSGKTTVQEVLRREYGLKPLDSYTSREPRTPNERGHLFVSREELLALPDKVAFTDYHGNLYCATTAQVEECDTYVIDLDGIKAFKSLYKGKKTPVCIALDLSEEVRLNRMMKRGDSEEFARSRIETDRKAFAEMRAMSDVIFHVEDKSPEELAERIASLLK